MLLKFDARYIYVATCLFLCQRCESRKYELIATDEDDDDDTFNKRSENISFNE